MSHIYRYFKDGAFLTGYASGSVRKAIPHGSSSDSKPMEVPGSEGAYVVVAPRVISKPIEAEPDDMYQGTLVPAEIAQPTAALMGSELNGGYGLPWTTGPGSLSSQPVALGSMLFTIGNGVAVSLGIGGESDLFSQVLVSYHRRGVGLRIHTGIGTARGGASRDPGGGNAVVPYGRPTPPSYPGRGTIEEGGPPGPIIDVPGLGPVQVPAEGHGSGGVHQHPGSSFLERWREDFGSLWDGFSDFGPWVFSQ